MANKTMSPTKVVIPCRLSFANIWEPKSINGGEEKYSVSCIIPKADKATLAKIQKAIEAAKEDAKGKKWGGKIPPNLKLPLRDGDIDRPDDENYADCMFLNATRGCPADCRPEGAADPGSHGLRVRRLRQCLGKLLWFLCFRQSRNRCRTRKYPEGAYRRTSCW